MLDSFMHISSFYFQNHETVQKPNTTKDELTKFKLKKQSLKLAAIVQYTFFLPHHQDNKTTDATDYKLVGLVFCEYPPKIAPFPTVFWLLAKPH